MRRYNPLQSLYIKRPIFALPLFYLKNKKIMMKYLINSTRNICCLHALFIKRIYNPKEIQLMSAVRRLPVVHLYEEINTI